MGSAPDVSSPTEARAASSNLMQATTIGGGRSRSSLSLFTWVFCSLLAVWHAMTLYQRGSGLGPDIPNYKAFYDTIGACDCLNLGPGINSEFLWSVLAVAGTSLGLSFQQWFVLIVSLQAITWMAFGFQASRLLGLSASHATLSIPLVLLVVHTIPFTQAGQTNVLRSGLAVPIGALATVLIAQERRKLASLFVLCAVGIQFEVSILMLVGIGTFLFLERNWSLWIGGVMSAVYALGVSTVLAGLIVPPSLLTLGLEYGAGAQYRTGVRLEFLIFSTAQFVLVWVFTRRETPDSFAWRTIPWLTGLAVPFLLLGGVAAYSDRWLQPFWSIASVLIAVLLFRRCQESLQVWLGVASLAALTALILFTW
jgi:hypothetical protein